MQNTTIFKKLKIQTQDVQLQEQSKMCLLYVKLSLEVLLAQTNSKYIEIRNLQRLIQSFQLLMQTKTIRKEKN